MASSVGSRARIFIKTGDIYEGYIHSVNDNIGKLTLQKVTICNGGETRQKLQGLQHFKVDEIEDIDILESADGHLKASSESYRDTGPKLYRPKETPKHLINRKSFRNELLLTVPDEEPAVTRRHDTSGSLKSSDYDSSSDVGEVGGGGQYCVVDKLDQVFLEAIEHIRGFSVIAVGLEGISLGREGKLCWLQVATRSQIYLFDILTLGGECFTQGVQAILESKQILKVMHDCRQASDLLYHQFGVELMNIFDTQVASVLIYRMTRNGDYPRYVESQHSLLVEHLDLDITDMHILRYRQYSEKQDQQIWSQRPAPNNILTAASKQVKHLLKLRVTLMDALLKEVSVGTDIYLNYVRSASPEAAKTALAQRHLLPHAFQKMQTYVDFQRHQFMRPSRRNAAGPQKDEKGFDENCNGVIDPFIVAGRDSIWHQGPNYKSPAYRRRSEGDRLLKPRPGGSKETTKSVPNSPLETSERLVHKQGHRISRGPCEVRRPSSASSDSASEAPIKSSVRALEPVPEATVPVKKYTEDTNVVFKPAGMIQDDLGKRRRNCYPAMERDFASPSVTSEDDSGKSPPHISEDYQKSYTSPAKEKESPLGTYEDEFGRMKENRHLTDEHDEHDFKPQSNHEQADSANIVFKPAGYYRNSPGKRKKNYYSDSDLDRSVQIGDYVSTDSEGGSFSCIPSRESLGRQVPSEPTSSIWKTLKECTNCEEHPPTNSAHQDLLDKFQNLDLRPETPISPLNSPALAKTVDKRLSQSVSTSSHQSPSSPYKLSDLPMTTVDNRFPQSVSTPSHHPPSSSPYKLSDIPMTMMTMMTSSNQETDSYPVYPEESASPIPKNTHLSSPYNQPRLATQFDSPGQQISPPASRHPATSYEEEQDSPMSCMSSPNTPERLISHPKTPTVTKKSPDNENLSPFNENLSPYARQKALLKNLSKSSNGSAGSSDNTSVSSDQVSSNSDKQHVTFDSLKKHFKGRVSRF